MLKRAFDIVLSILALLVLSPLLLILSALIYLKLGSPVIFRQSRSGLNGVPFKIIKFRSMNDARDHEGNLLADEDRLGSFGKFLRSTSLDELPELVNVVLGQMSLVGPRPLYEKYFERYSEEQKRRLNVKPGITGLAQVSGRNQLTWEQKFDLDLWYVDNQSFWLDLKILFKTVKMVLIRDGISSKTSVTMEEFKG